MTWNRPVEDAFTQTAVFSTIRQKLEAANYTEAGLAALLDIEVPSLRPQGSREQLIWRLRGMDEPLATLARLFYLGDEVSRQELTPIFDADEVGELLRFDFLIKGREPDTVGTCFGITPCRDVLVVSDSLAQRAEVRYGDGGPVMGPGSDSETLLRTTPRRKLGRVLDLCTGPGTHGLVASGQADEVFGVDVAERALTLARVNASLNDSSNLQFLYGDVTKGPGSDGLPEGLFDLVLANPPFVPNSHPELLYRDGGGALGDDVLNAIITRLGSLLSPDGQARIITDVAYRKGETLKTKLAQLLGDQLSGFDVIAVEDPSYDIDAYCEFHSVRLVDGRMIQESATATALKEHYAALGISKICHVLFAFRRSTEGGKHLFRRASSLIDLTDLDLQRVFDFWDLVRRFGPRNAALDCVPKAREAVSLVHRTQLAKGRQDAFNIEFGARSPWLASRTTRELYQLLMLCDGARSGREVVEVLCENAGVPLKPATEFVVKAILSLTEVGVLDLVERQSELQSKEQS